MPRTSFRIVASLAAAAMLALTTSATQAQGRCFEEPSAAQRAGTADEVHTRARESFQAKRFEEAASLFAFVATEHSTSSVGLTAAQLSLESMNAARSPECLEALTTLLPRYQMLFCGGGAKGNEEACGTFSRMSADLRRLEAQTVVQQADRSRGERARKLYLEAGRLYSSLWTDAYQSACKKLDTKGCARSDEVLYNAARAYQAGRDVGKATAMRMALIDPQFHLHETALARRTPYELGSSFQAIGEYDRAAEWYERFATTAPKDEHAPVALSDAVILRLGLGDLDKAAKNAELFLKNYSARQEQAAKISLALAAEWLRRGDASRAEKTLDAAAGRILKALPGARAQLDVLLGKSLARQQKNDAALKAFQRAATVKFTPSPGTNNDDADTQRAIARELSAVGEAQLALADRARDDAAKILLKKGDAASLRDKQDAVRDADKLYAKILEIQPAPPPESVVLAGARLARLRSQLWAQAHLAGAAEAEALLTDARAAHRRCLDLAVRFQWIDAESEGCAAWLARHFPAEFHFTRQLSPRATWSAPGAFAMPEPLDEHGDPALPAGSMAP